MLSDADGSVEANSDPNTDWEAEGAKIEAQIELLFTIIQYFNLDYDKYSKLLKCQELYYSKEEYEE